VQHLLPSLLLLLQCLLLCTRLIRHSLLLLLLLWRQHQPCTCTSHACSSCRQLARPYMLDSCHRPRSSSRRSSSLHHVGVQRLEEALHVCCLLLQLQHVLPELGPSCKGLVGVTPGGLHCLLPD
jgi:hypothetical protein